jgi:hypothetical protein
MSIETPKNSDLGDNEGWDINRALAEINVIKQRVMTTGAVDIEREALDELMTEVGRGLITPADGVAKARSIERERQDYH